MIRQVKISQEKRDCCLRKLGLEDQAKLNLLLGNVVIPKEFEDDQEELNAPEISLNSSDVVGCSRNSKGKDPLSQLIDKETMNEYLSAESPQKPQRGKCSRPHAEETAIVQYSPSPRRDRYDNTFTLEEIDIMSQVAKFMGQRCEEKARRSSKPTATPKAPPQPSKKRASSEQEAQPAKKKGPPKVESPGAPREGVGCPKCRGTGCTKCKDPDYAGVRCVGKEAYIAYYQAKHGCPPTTKK